MKRGRLVTLFFVFAASACGGSKGPPPRVAEVPIDDGAPRAPGAAAPGGVAGSAGASVAIPGLVGDPSAAFGGGGGAGGGGAGGGGASAAAGAAGGGGGGAGGGGGLPEKLPALLPTMTDVPGSGGSAPTGGTTAVKPLPPKAERLTASDCNKIMDKYIELVGISQGISPDAISGVMGMLRNSVSNDANYANALGSCQKENTKTQYRCAMKANDVDGWKKCLQ